MDYCNKSNKLCQEIFILTLIRTTRLCASSPKTRSPKTEIAETRAELNIIETKDRRKEYRRNRDHRHKDRRNKDRRIPFYNLYRRSSFSAIIFHVRFRCIQIHIQRERLFSYNVGIMNCNLHLLQ